MSQTKTLDDLINGVLSKTLDARRPAKRRAFAPEFTRQLLRNLRRVTGLTQPVKILAYFAGRPGYKVAARAVAPPAPQSMRGAPAFRAFPASPKKLGELSGKLG